MLLLLDELFVSGKVVDLHALNAFVPKPRVLRLELVLDFAAVKREE